MAGTGEVTAAEKATILAYTGACTMTGEIVVHVPTGLSWTIDDATALLEKYYPCDGYLRSEGDPDKAFYDKLHQGCLKERPINLHLMTTPSQLCWKGMGSEDANHTFADLLEDTCADVLTGASGKTKCNALERAVEAAASDEWWETAGTGLGGALGLWAIFGPAVHSWPAMQRWLLSLGKKAGPAGIGVAVLGGAFAYSQEAEAAPEHLAAAQGSGAGLLETATNILAYTGREIVCGALGCGEAY